mmetsp:Transcript_34323/g.60730  ORF Transcript_34323/g.60730 Transcript_34323/m.60730 type:complete len:210 (-) Transcript_34323:499-1128(-)
MWPGICQRVVRRHAVRHGWPSRSGSELLVLLAPPWVDIADLTRTRNEWRVWWAWWNIAMLARRSMHGGRPNAIYVIVMLACPKLARWAVQRGRVRQAAVVTRPWRRRQRRGRRRRRYRRCRRQPCRQVVIGTDCAIKTVIGEYGKCAQLTGPPATLQTRRCCVGDRLPPPLQPVILLGKAQRGVLFSGRLGAESRLLSVRHFRDLVPRG